jgi:hypothetical protein
VDGLLDGEGEDTTAGSAVDVFAPVALTRCAVWIALGQCARLKKNLPDFFHIGFFVEDFN